ncbi:endoprotease endo-Pro [Xylariaceae sp. FL1272]|nr:endoprotease endo-Pro [Xylariaceae sp. FL1272]
MYQSRSQMLFFLAICARLALGLLPTTHVQTVDEVSDTTLAALADPSDNLTGIAYFDQYIDHGSPELGIFPQTWWYNATFWKGPGSPIVILTPGEVAAGGYMSYLSNDALSGMVAQEIGAAVVLVEHRYWGNSTPFANQTTKNLQYLTLNQSVSDFVHFARTVKLPFDDAGSSNAPQAPWIWIGGSYSGALGAWIESLVPGTMWATHASSAPVQAIYDYWQYFDPIRQGMPQNCSQDYSKIIDHVDSILLEGTDKEQDDLKKMFGLEDLSHKDDIASAISSPIWLWQGIQFTSGYSQFYQMCDAIQGVMQNTTQFPIDGVGLKRALPNFAKWFKSNYLPNYCFDSYGYSDWKDPMSVGCFDSYNKSSPGFTDWTANNTFDRPWVWMTCNEPLFYYQTGAPATRQTMFSRLVDAQYYQRQCELFFPKEGNYTYASAEGRTEDDVNKLTKGWDLPNVLGNKSRIIWVNGEFDPWRSASVASEFRTGSPVVSTPDEPYVLIPEARHCNDLRKRNGDASWNVAIAQGYVTSQMSTWADEFYSSN